MTRFDALDADPGQLLRARWAIGAIAGATAHEALVSEVLAALAGAVDPDDRALRVHASHDLERGVWQVEGPVQRLGPALEALAHRVWGRPPPLPAGAARFGAWIEAARDAVDLGWWVGDSTPLAPLIADPPAGAALAAWAAARGLERCAEHSRSLAPESPVVGVVLELAGLGAALEQLHAALDALDALRVAEPDLSVAACFGHYEHGGLVLHAELTGRGVARAGVGARSPSAELCTALAVTLGAPLDEPLALLEALLDAPGPDQAILWRTADGLELERRYTPATTTPTDAALAALR